MNLKWMHPDTQNFVTNVGLVTSKGPIGHNIMACEWTHYISYAPALISLGISKNNQSTMTNIKESKEFGISIAAHDQNIISSVAGGSQGITTNKIEILKELGTEFYEAEIIDVLMVAGASINMECKLVEIIDIGDHPLVIGEIEKISSSDKEPLIYHAGKYWAPTQQIEKPSQEVLDKIDELKEKYSK